jgi:hypothetical protein
MPGLLGRPASGSLSSAGSGSFSLAPAVVDAFKFEHESRRSRAAQELEDARATFRRENEELNQELDRAQAEVSGAAEKGRMMRQQALQLRSKVDNLQMQVSSGGAGGHKLLRRAVVDGVHGLQVSVQAGGRE